MHEVAGRGCERWQLSPWRQAPTRVKKTHALLQGTQKGGRKVRGVSAGESIGKWWRPARALARSSARQLSVSGCDARLAAAPRA